MLFKNVICSIKELKFSFKDGLLTLLEDLYFPQVAKKLIKWPQMAKVARKLLQIEKGAKKVAEQLVAEA